MKPAHKGMIAGSILLTSMATGMVSVEEGRQLKAYQDVVGVWTICDGYTHGVKKGDLKTPAECNQLLSSELVATERSMDACLLVDVPGKTKVSMLDFTYNVGPGGFCGSTVVKRANAGDLAGACDAMLAWNKGRIMGVLVVIPGLDKRRHVERDLCREGLAA